MDRTSLAEARPAVGRLPAALALAALATATFAAWLGWGPGGELMTLYVDDLGTVAAALAASVLCFQAGGRQVGALRRFWLLLAAACAA